MYASTANSALGVATTLKTFPQCPSFHGGDCGHGAGVTGVIDSPQSVLRPSYEARPTHYD